MLIAENGDEEESSEEIEPDDNNTKQDDDDNETEKDLLEDENDEKFNISEMSSDCENKTIFYREPNESQYQCKECNFSLCIKCYNLCKKCYNL